MTEINITESLLHTRNPARRAIPKIQNDVLNPESMKIVSAYVLAWEVVIYINLKLIIIIIIFSRVYPLYSVMVSEGELTLFLL